MRSSPGLPRPCLNHPNHAIRGSMAMPVKVLKLALEPENSEVRLMTGYLRLKQGKLNDALNSFQRASALARFTAPALNVK